MEVKQIADRAGRGETKVSVALASYQGARFLGEQLASLAAQTRLPDELVLCDDGSTDDTLAVASAFAASAPFAVRIERNPVNLGFNRNFERLLSLAAGDVVFISDQDDIWYPDKIARALAALEADPAALSLINDEDLMDGEGKRLGATYLGNVRKLGFPDSHHVAGCCTALRRAFLDLAAPFPEGINYDVWLSTLADLLGARLVLDVPLQLYRRHDGNTTETVLARESASLWALVRTYGLADPRAGWEEHIRILGIYRRRIEERRAVAVALVGEERVADAFERIDRERDGLSRRLAVLAKPRVRRLPAVLGLWRRGFYSRFAGGRSAIKDIIRA